MFVAAFVRAHGSIKEMERTFGVSYPTNKSRLKRIAEHLDFVDIDPAPTGADVYRGSVLIGHVIGSVLQSIASVLLVGAVAVRVQRHAAHGAFLVDHRRLAWLDARVAPFVHPR